LAAVRKQEDVESLLAEAGTRRVVGAVEPIILDVTDAGQIAAAVEIVRLKSLPGADSTQSLTMRVHNGPGRSRHCR